MHLKANSNSQTLEELKEQVPSLPLWTELLPALMWPKKAATHELSQSEAWLSLRFLHLRQSLGLGSLRTPIWQSQICVFLPKTNRKSLAWLRPKNQTIEAARHNGWLKGFKTTICILPDKQLAEKKMLCFFFKSIFSRSNFIVNLPGRG